MTPLYFLLAPSFHGATLLSLLLGNHSRVAALGDTLPTKRFDQICGCGEKVSECQFWLDADIATRYTSDTGDTLILPQSPQLSPSKKFNRLIGYRYYRRLASRGVQLPDDDYVGAYHRFVAYSLRYSGKRIFLDGGKNINRALRIAVSSLSMAGAIHVVRDAPAYVNSYRKNMGDDSLSTAIGEYINYHKRCLSIAKFLGDRYHRIRYEDLISDTENSLDSLFNFLDIEPEQVQFPVGPNVHWMGNASLFSFDGSLYKRHADWRKNITDSELARIYRKTHHIRRHLGYRQ